MTIQNKSLRTRLVLILTITCVAVGSVSAQTQDSSNIKAIESLAVQWQAAWNSRDADALTSLLADDIDFVTVLGPRAG